MFNDTANMAGDAVAFNIMKDGGSVPMHLPVPVEQMELAGVSGSSFLVPHGKSPSVPNSEMRLFGFPVQRFREFIANFRNGPFRESRHEVASMVSQSSEVREPNRNYRFIPWQPVMKCRIFMPRNQANEHIVHALVDAFKSDDEICNIPAVKEYLVRYPDDRQPIVELLGHIAGGSTRYETVGRYKGEDEVCQVTEYITYDPDVGGGGRELFWALALDVITHLIARRFAEHLGFEREVWMKVQFAGSLYLFRFVQDALIQEAA